MYEIKENSIELWAIEAEKLFKQNAQPMDDDLAKTFLACCLNEDKIENDKDVLDQLVNKKLGYCSVFYNRVKYCHTYEVSLAACLFMGQGCNSFGEVTIYANYLQYQAHRHNVKRVDIRFIGMYVFPMGLPSKEILQKVWDMQKVIRKDAFDSDNLLDYGICQKSISLKS